jgi:hypothetical protein
MLTKAQIQRIAQMLQSLGSYVKLAVDMHREVLAGEGVTFE